MKKIIFLFLLATATVANCVQDVDLKLKNLNDAQLKKVYGLSELSAEIAEKQGLIASWCQQAIDLLGYPEEFTPELKETFNSFVQKFEKAFCEKKDVNGILAEESSVTENYAFNFVEVFLVRYYFEKVLVARLVERYEKCLQELIEIDCKLNLPKKV